LIHRAPGIFFGFKNPRRSELRLLCKVCSIGLSFPCFSPRSTRHLDLQSCTCPSPLYQPFDYHPPFVPLWLLTLGSPTSCLLGLLLGQAVPHLTSVHLLPQSASHIWQLSTSLPQPTTIYELHPAIPLPLSSRHSLSKTSRFRTASPLLRSSLNAESTILP
jgi:hypothetical protein